MCSQLGDKATLGPTGHSGLPWGAERTSRGCRRECRQRSEVKEVTPKRQAEKDGAGSHRPGEKRLGESSFFRRLKDHLILE